jgi:hypothetical protein
MTVLAGYFLEIELGPTGIKLLAEVGFGTRASLGQAVG